MVLSEFWVFLSEFLVESYLQGDIIPVSLAAVHQELALEQTRRGETDQKLPRSLSVVVDMDPGSNSELTLRAPYCYEIPFVAPHPIATVRQDVPVLPPFRLMGRAPRPRLLLLGRRGPGPAPGQARHLERLFRRG